MPGWPLGGATSIPWVWLAVPRGPETPCAPPLHDSQGPRKWTKGDPELCRVPSLAPALPSGQEGQWQHSLVQLHQGLGDPGARDLSSPLGFLGPVTTFLSGPHQLCPLLLFPENSECADLDSGTASYALSDRGNRRPHPGSPSTQSSPPQWALAMLRLLPMDRSHRVLHGDALTQLTPAWVLACPSWPKDCTYP